MRGVEAIRGETSDGQTSDVRLTLRRETYRPLTAGSMVPGDFSTPLEMTEEVLCDSI